MVLDATVREDGVGVDERLVTGGTTPLKDASGRLNVAGGLEVTQIDDTRENDDARDEEKAVSEELHVLVKVRDRVYGQG